MSCENEVPNEYRAQYEVLNGLVYREFPEGLSDEERNCLALGLLEGSLAVSQEMQNLLIFASNGLDATLVLTFNALKSPREEVWRQQFREIDRSGNYFRNTGARYFIDAFKDVFTVVSESITPRS